MKNVKNVFLEYVKKPYNDMSNQVVFCVRKFLNKVVGQVYYQPVGVEVSSVTSSSSFASMTLLTNLHVFLLSGKSARVCIAFCNGGKINMCECKSALQLTIYFIETFHLGPVVKIFPKKATAEKNAEQSEKNNKKFIIIE